MHEFQGKLTKNERKVYRFIKHRIEKNCIPPTIREIMNHFGHTSPNSAHRLVKSLESKGYISREKGTSRGIFLKETAELNPKIWMVEAGKIFAHRKRDIQNQPILKIDIPADKIVICVQDNSLSEFGIHTNDTLVAQRPNSDTPLPDESKVFLTDISNKVYAALCKTSLNDDGERTYTFHTLSNSPSAAPCPQDPSMVHSLIEMQIAPITSGWQFREK